MTSDGKVPVQLAGGFSVAVLFLGSTLLTPLYELYRADYSLGALAVTLIYAVYVIGNLGALLFLGRLSDELGRRPVVFAGLALAAAAAALFLLADGPAWLFAGRVVSGLAVGIGSGAATAWISEALPERRRAEAASIMTSYNFAGLAAGPILAGLLVQYAPAPLRLPFLLYLLLAGTTALLVGFARETAATSQHGLDLRPRLGVPAGKRLAFVAPATAGFAAMAVVGFFAALGPALIHQTLKIDNHAVSGLIVAEMFVVAAAAIRATRSLAARPTLIGALLTLPVGLALLAATQSWPGLGLLLAGTTVAGIASALGYRGGLTVVNQLAPQDRRAEVASSYFTCCFLGNALPVIGVGALSQAMGLPTAARIFAGVLAAIALLALGVALTVKPDE